MKTRRSARRLARKVSIDDHSRGSPLARTTLVAYGDFASPACAQTYRTVKKIQRRMGQQLRYVYRSGLRTPASTSFASGARWEGESTPTEFGECARVAFAAESRRRRRSSSTPSGTRAPLVSRLCSPRSRPPRRVIGHRTRGAEPVGDPRHARFGLSGSVRLHTARRPTRAPRGLRIEFPELP